MSVIYVQIEDASSTEHKLNQLARAIDHLEQNFSLAHEAFVEEGGSDAKMLLRDLAAGVIQANWKKHADRKNNAERNKDACLLCPLYNKRIL